MIVLSLGAISNLESIPCGVGVVELYDPDEEMIFAFRKISSLPVIAKIVSSDVNSLLGLGLDYIDLDFQDLFWENPEPELFPETKFIISYHNYNDTPSDLEGILDVLDSFGADVIKIATTAQNTNDGLRILRLLAAHDSKNIAAVAMGEEGFVSRVLGLKYGSYFTYLALTEDRRTASGQFTLKDFIDKYSRITAHTKVMGLIGDPVDKSHGFSYHNSYYTVEGIDAIYLPFRLREYELEEFIGHFRKLYFYGLSVTMPLKSHVVNYIDFDKSLCNVVNTICNCNGILESYNTDSLAFWGLLGEHFGSVQGVRVVVLGTGGVARAVVAEGVRRGAEMTVLGRDFAKSRSLADEYNCDYGSLLNLSSSIEIIVNCTPIGMYRNDIPVDLKDVEVDLVADFVSNPSETAFISGAIKKGCRVIDGLEIFYRQAELQNKIWFCL